MSKKFASGGEIPRRQPSADENLMIYIPEPAGPTCGAKKDLLLGGHTEASLECGREENHEGVWHVAQETLEEKDGQRIGYVQFNWRELP